MYFLLVQKVPKIHFFFSMRKRNKKKLKLKTVEKFRMFPIKRTIIPDKKQTVADSLHKTQFSPQIKL